MIDNRWLNTSGFPGLSDDILLMIRRAGFQRIDLDPAAFITTPDESVLLAGESIGQALLRYGLHISHLRTLEDFPGAPHPVRWQKREELRQLIARTLAAGSDTLLATAPVSPGCHPALADDDLRWMASEAARFNLRIIYQPLSHGVIDSTLAEAWEHISQLDQPNIGLMADWLTLISGDNQTACLERIPADRIYQVQLYDPQDPRIAAVADAGRSISDLHCFTDKLRSAGYRGPAGIVPDLTLPADEALTRAAANLHTFWPLSG